MADRILGMGDIVSLVEKAQQEFDEKQARELERKIAKISLISTISLIRSRESRRWDL